MENEKLVTPSLLPPSLTIFAIIVTGLEEPEVEDDLLAREHPHLYIWLLKGIVICLLHWCIDDSLTLFVLPYFICSLQFAPKHAKPLWNSETISFSGKILVLFASCQTIAWWLYPNPMVTILCILLNGLFLISVSMAMDANIANDDQINNWMFLWRPYCGLQ